jgi:SAM-dependent methyltransferase
VNGVLAIYGAALRRASDGIPAELDLVDTAGRVVRRVDAGRWCAHLWAGDAGLLTRCAGPTLDVGCGPGRLVAALTATGTPALGIDISAEAVRQARRRGAAALRRCVFTPVPDEGQWQHVLLVDGNVGIGGDPATLLTRCRRLLASGGDALVELDPPGTASWRTEVRLHGDTGVSGAFAWAAVSMDDLAALADSAAMRVVERWTEANRWFARVTTA